MSEKTKNTPPAKHGAKLKKRNELILKLISEAGEEGISLNELIDELEKAEGMRRGRGTISDNIKALKEMGYRIENNGAKKRYYIVNDESFIPYEDITGYEMLTDKMVLGWMILFFMEREKGFVTFDRIAKYYRDKVLRSSDNDTKNNSGNPDTADEAIENDSTLRNILDDLKNKGYITISDKNDIGALLTYEEKQIRSNARFYSLSDSAPVVTLIKTDDSDIFSDYFTNSGYAGELREVLCSISEKLDKVFRYYGTDISPAYRTTGRVNKIDEELLAKLNYFLKLPFKTKAVLVKHTGNPEGDVIKTGIIIFSTEKNMFYIIGEKPDKKTDGERHFLVIRVDSIISADPLDELNDIYENRFYMEMFRKMWGVTPEEPVETEILFDNVTFVRKKVERLHQLRGETAEVIFPPEEDTDKKIVYKDKIIGFSDFLPYIRSMGSSAVILRPKSARELMIERTKDIIENYKELHEKWEKEQTDMNGSNS